MAIESLKCSFPELKCAVSVKYSLDFKDFAQKNHVKETANNVLILLHE